MKSIPGIDEKSSKAILDLLKSEPAIEAVILFGSRAKGNFRTGSDIDLCLMGPKLNYDSLTGLQLRYQKLFLPWKLDLVIEHLISEPALTEHIRRVGVRIVP